MMEQLLTCWISVGNSWETLGKLLGNPADAIQNPVSSLSKTCWKPVKNLPKSCWKPIRNFLLGGYQEKYQISGISGST